MSRYRPLLAFLCMFVGLSAATASAQIVVYELEFEHADGFNIDFYTGGYFIAPALGGEGTFVLTGIEDGRRVLEPDGGSGTFFTGVSASGKRFTTVSATAGNTAATGGSYLAFAEALDFVSFKTPRLITRVRIAKTLRGKAVAASDEGGALAFDGSSGYAHSSRMTFRMADSLTADYNKEALEVADAVSLVTRLLRSKGFYSASDTSESTDTTN